MCRGKNIKAGGGEDGKLIQRLKQSSKALGSPGFFQLLSAL